MRDVGLIRQSGAGRSDRAVIRRVSPSGPPRPAAEGAVVSHAISGVSALILGAVTRWVFQANHPPCHASGVKIICALGGRKKGEKKRGSSRLGGKK